MNLIENDCFGGCFRYKSSLNQLYDRLIVFFNLLIELFDLKIDLLIEIDQIYIEKDRFYIEKDRFYIEIKIIDSDSSLDFESDRNRQSRSTILESESSTIRLVSPNCISLI